MLQAWLKKKKKKKKNTLWLPGAPLTFFFFFFFGLFVFSGLHLRHMEFPRLGV